jgi:hypothetical protein
MQLFFRHDAGNVASQEKPSNDVQKDKAEMLKNIRGYLRSRQRTPQIIRRHFMEEHVHYAA